MFTAVHRALEAVTARGKPRAELEAGIAALAKVEAHAVERRLALTAAIDNLSDGGIDGAGVTRSRARRSKKAAKKAAQTAEQLGKMPETRAALARGEINEEHADAAAAAAARTSPAEADIALAAKAKALPADMFAKQSQEWANAKERDHARRERHLRQRETREARTWSDADGMTCLFARFDPTTGSSVRKAFQAEIDRLWRADGGRDGTPDEVRTPDQRGADAIAALLTSSRVSDSGENSGNRRPHPRFQVHIRLDASRCRTDHPNGLAELIDGTPLPQEVLERIACEAAFVGAVFAADGSVLWQGRSIRTATDAQWNALIHRDGGCVICAAEPSHCQAHHLDPWAPPTAGPTDIDNMALVCNTDHHLIHDHGHQLSRSDGEWQLRPRGSNHRSGRPPPRSNAA